MRRLMYGEWAASRLGQHPESQTTRKPGESDKHRRAEQYQDRRYVPRQAGGHRRADDRADRRSGGDEPEQALSLLGVEQIDVHLPEDRDDEEVIDRDPDEEDPADPHRLLGVGEMQRGREQQDVEREKPIGQRDEAAA